MLKCRPEKAILIHISSPLRITPPRAEVSTPTTVLFSNHSPAPTTGSTDDQETKTDNHFTTELKPPTPPIPAACPLPLMPVPANLRSQHPVISSSHPSRTSNYSPSTKPNLHQIPDYRRTSERAKINK